MSVKKAKFFCENCGAEVPQNAKFCKNCGKFFTSVRCPECGMSGPASMFINGCPYCGYALNKKTETTESKDIKFILSRSKKKYRKNQMEKNKSSLRENDNSLPAWIYILTGIALSTILIFIFMYLNH